ncbi:auxin response factor 9-like [Cryptomeria japonica]|uniref:auxin response factor 9-like n=1 Tax=Cryptomeria japonica TaxID=3369 RepID=UPI0027DA741A|nr:auxin response factor 9-like [Cryptomeria japonica]XP_059071971.1 auxin response factor 9-like [Cryptomeria japonica]
MIRGSEKRRHLLTAGWRVFVNSERLVAGDAFIFMRDKNGELHVGVGVPCISKVTFLSVVISSRRMEIFVLAAASHAIPGRAMFRVYYKPRQKLMIFPSSLLPLKLFSHSTSKYLLVLIKFYNP